MNRQVIKVLAALGWIFLFRNCSLYTLPIAAKIPGDLPLSPKNGY